MKILSDIKRVLKLSTKPSKKVYWEHLKVCIIGAWILGTIGFLIHYIAIHLLA